MSILKWLAYLPVVVLGKLLTIVCAPVAAYLSMRGDALPALLRWMQTHDNPIDALQRSNPFVSQLGAALGLDAAGIDALFVEAKL